MAGSSTMLRSSHKRPGYLQALDRVKERTRARFKLPQDAAILVTEVACALPGCPPLETVVAFWTDADTRHHFKVFKPVAEVVADDLPPAWLKKRAHRRRGRGPRMLLRRIPARVRLNRRRGGLPTAGRMPTLKRSEPSSI